MQPHGQWELFYLNHGAYKIEKLLQLFKTGEKIPEDLLEVPVQYVALSEFYKETLQ